MQHKLAMAEIDPLREAGRPGRIEGRGARVLVEVGKREIRRAGSEHSLVSISKSGWYRDFAGVVDQDKAINSVEPILDLLKHRKELSVDKQSTGTGMVQCVCDLLGCQPHIYGHQHRPHHRDGKIALEVAMAVPVHHRPSVAAFNTKR